MKILRVFLCALTLVAASCTSCRNNKQNNDMANPLDGPVVVMQTTKGTMKIKLYNATPAHRDNFLKLAREGFYDGLKFHRVIEGFMIQGGDPLSKDDSLTGRWGTGGPGYTIPAEMVSEARHCKGALAAARLGDMANPKRASSGSQFYIVQSESGCRHLDGQYSVYGQVVEGLEVIDAIASVSTDPYDRPLEPVVILKVTVQDDAVAAAADSTAVAGDSTAVAADTVAKADSLK